MKELGYRRIETNKKQWRCCSTIVVLKDCDLEFPKMEDTCPRLLVALIPSYKRRTHERKKKWAVTQGINWREKQKKKRNQERAWKLKLKRNCRDQSEISFSYSFLVFYLFMGTHLMAETLLFIFLSQIMNWNWLWLSDKQS